MPQKAARLRLLVDAATAPAESERVDPEIVAIGRECYGLMQRHEKALAGITQLGREIDQTPAIPGFDPAMRVVPPALLPRDKPMKSVSEAREVLHALLPKVIEAEGQRARLNELLGSWRSLSPRERATERRFLALEQSIAQMRDDLAALRNSAEAAMSHGAAPRKQRATARSGVKPGTVADGHVTREQREALTASIHAQRARHG